ncbi:MAG: energy-coupling factor transporter transmembrane protein EcfT [Oscillospiraceae bacterium]|nr:energy-coupling factor transporter transmembrane protein EcfT [Oscillospiraceae bacterium]
MKNESFSGFHPVVNLAFFVAVLGTTMFIMNPVYLSVSIISSCAYLAYLKGGKGFVQQAAYLIPILFMMAIINPIFNHEGVTVLFYLHNDNPVTLEAALFGLASATMMGASIVWFNCCNTVFTSDKIIYLFGRIIPAMSLLISMTLRFVPRFMNYLQNVMRVQKGLHQPKNTKEKLRQALFAFSATVSWAMEQSIISADSMKSRGFGSAGRTAYSIYIFEKRDAATLICLTLLVLGTVIPCVLGYTAWTYYPNFSGELFGIAQFAGYFCYCGMCLLPLIIDLTEERKWNSLRSKI